MSNKVLFPILAFSGLTLALSTWMASAQTMLKSASSGQTPEIICTLTECHIASSSEVRNMLISTPSGLNVNPTVIAPPAGQRLQWDEPGCADLISYTSLSNAYEFVSAPNIPVPLGTTHISLEAVTQGYISGTIGNGNTSATGGSFGRLQISRHGANNWINVATGYSRHAFADTKGYPTYGIGKYIGLVDLANLPPINDVGTIPSAIDVRIMAHTNTSSDFVVNQSFVCKGQLIVTL